MAHSNEGSPFVELFRYPTNGALLSELLRQPDTELTAADIARAADEIADIEGTVVPMEVISGNPTVFWDALIESNEEDIDEPISEEEVDEIVESDVSPLDEAAGSISLWWHSSDGQATTDEM